MALAVVDSLRIPPLPAATGQPRADALAILENLRIDMLRRDGMATLGTFLAEEHRNPLLMDHFRRRLIQPRRERLRHALAVGVEDGQLPVGADLDAMASLLVGSLYARYLSTGNIPPGWPAEPSLPSGRTKPAGLTDKPPGTVALAGFRVSAAGLGAAHRWRRTG